MNYQLKRTTAHDNDFKGLIKLLDAELVERNGDIQDLYKVHNKTDFIKNVVVAYANSAPVGCGSFKTFEGQAEIKRMFVNQSYRGKGIAKSILSELENWAKELKFTHTVLETGHNQIEAIALYKKTGYRLIPNYGPYMNLPDSICMRKTL